MAIRSCLKPLTLSVLVALLGSTNVAFAEESSTETKHKAGYDKKPDFGGPDSPQGQLEEDDRVKEPAFRFPAFDEAFSSWNQFKSDINNEHGFKFGGHYSTMYQSNGDDSGWSGMLRVNAQWTVLGNGTATPGFFSFLADNRHEFGDSGVPGDFGKFGQYGITGTQFGSFDGNFKIVTMAWNHKVTEDTGYIIGSYDPNDYMNVQGYVNPQTTFSNMNILLETSVNLADSSWGAAAGHWFNDSVYLQAGINDANGYGGDGNVFFEGGAELFKWAHLGWSPSRNDRYFKNVHVAAWHADEREDAGQESVWGMSGAVNWTFNDVYMPFAKIGFSEGDHTFFNNTATAGMIYQVGSKSDLLGLAAHWGKFGEDHSNGLGGESQVSSELFYRFQFSQNLAITPSVQYIDNPLLSATAADAETIFGVRARVTF